tara:strand:+ start:178 stop:393 length:216 start_codon:yes stop_codon:yes gene_type:complete
MLAGPLTGEDANNTDLLLSLGLTPDTAWGSALARVGLSENMDLGVEARVERDFGVGGKMGWEVMGQVKGSW